MPPRRAHCRRPRTAQRSVGDPAWTTSGTVITLRAGSRPPRRRARDRRLDRALPLGRRVASRTTGCVRPAGGSRGASGRSAGLLSAGSVLEPDPRRPVRFRRARRSGCRSTSGRNRTPSTATAGRRRGTSSTAPTTGWRSSTITPADAWPFPYRARQDVRADRRRAARDAVGRKPRPRDDAGRTGLPPLFPAHAGLPAGGAGRRDVGDRRRGDADGVDRAPIRGLPRATGCRSPRWRSTTCSPAGSGRRRSSWPERGARLSLDADPPLGFLVVYSPPGEDYLLRRAGQPLHRRVQSRRARSQRYRYADARARRKRVGDGAFPAEPRVAAGGRQQGGKGK